VYAFDAIQVDRGDQARDALLLISQAVSDEPALWILDLCLGSDGKALAEFRFPFGVELSSDFIETQLVVAKLLAT
jgi:hypothetical protein